MYRDPADAVKVVKWKEHYYLDLGIAFGWIHGSSSFQLIADVITHIMREKGFQVFAYIDNFILVNPKHKAKKAFDTLYDLLTELGLPMNEDKTVPPSSKLTCSGIHIDIPNNTLSIDTEKGQAIYDVCANIITKSHISKRQMQSLLGKLLYLHKCVKPARTFVNQILMTFRNSTSKRILITDAFKQDLLWFLKFLPAYNGVSTLNKKCIDNSHTLHIDASLTGLEGGGGLG